MTYVGDFPPCTHKFVNSNGVVLCERCGAFPQGRTMTLTSTQPGPRLPSRPA